MKIRTSLVVGSLVASLLTQPLAGLAAVTAPNSASTVAAESASADNAVSLHLVSVILEDMTTSAGKLLAKVDSKTVNEIDAANSAVAEKEINDQIAATKTSPEAVESLRNEARTTAVSEAKRAKNDLTTKLMNASVETLDRYGNVLRGNPTYKDAAAAYAAAYTRTEKAKVLTNIVQQDMDQVLAASLKRLNWLTADGLRIDLQNLKSRVFEGKGDGDGNKKLKRILLIAGAAVAFVGLATWGIASIHYGSKLKAQRNVDEAAYQAKKADLDAKFAKLKADLKGQRDALAATQQAELDALVKQLSDQYDALSIKLHDDEMNFLNTNGYVWMQCNSYTQPSSIICNNYNYQVFQGNSTCTVMCYKNVVQNKETLHAAPVCSSPYIPADCFSQSKYNAEYNAAYNQGYSDKYPVGLNQGTHDGQIQGAADGKTDGTADGDYDGYYDGYDYGYSKEYASAYTSGYNSRYNDGYEDGYNDGYNSGYSAGYDEGYDDGYSDGYNSVGSGLSSIGMVDRSSSSVARHDAAFLKLVNPKLASSTKPQYKKGFEDGRRDARLVLSLQSNKS